MNDTDLTMDAGPVAAEQAPLQVQAVDDVEHTIAALKAVIGALDGPTCNLVIARLRAEFGG